jgi:hypothetical protein
MPLFYFAIQFGNPVEQPLMRYGGQGHSWLYYFGRPGTTFLGAMFGFFSDLHLSFRYICWLSLLLAIALDTLSMSQVSQRLGCVLTGLCPERAPWSYDLLQIYYVRDLVACVINVWGILLVSYLIVYIGFCRQYYTYRQLTVGDHNRVLKLQEVYATYFGDLYDQYFSSPDRGRPSRASLKLQDRKGLEDRSAVTQSRKRASSGVVQNHSDNLLLEAGHGSGGGLPLLQLPIASENMTSQPGGEEHDGKNRKAR